MSEPHGLHHVVRRSRRQPRRTAVGLGLVVAAFACALAWRWWPPAVLAGYPLLTASTIALRRGSMR